MIELSNSFMVPAPLDEAWGVLLDVERIAPCMPGARLDAVTAETFTGSVRVKLGAMVMTYRGSLRIVETDANSHRAVLEASGNESRGGGSASATVVMALAPATSADRAATEVTVHTSLQVTGKPAQFGRGVMAEVSERLIAQFADRLRDEISAPRSVTTGGSADTAAASDAPQPSRAPNPVHADDSIDLLSVARGALAKRAAIGAVGAAVLVALGMLARRSRGPRRRLPTRRIVTAVWTEEWTDSPDVAARS